MFIVIISHSKNFDSQTALEMIFENSESGSNLLELNCQSNANVAVELYKVAVKRTSSLIVKVGDKTSKHFCE